MKEEENMYTYVRAAPTNQGDPQGLQANCCFLKNCVNTPVDQNTLKTVWKCLWNCQSKASAGFGNWAKCIARCVGREFLPDLVATLICCYVYWYNYSDITAGYNNPCLHPDVHTREDRWATCCDFSYQCKCKILAAFEGGSWLKSVLALQKCDTEYKNCLASPFCYPLK